MGGGAFVKLRCGRGTLDALAGGLSGFGAAGEAPDWLVSAVWLRTREADYLATACVEVLSDGTIGRTLCIATPEEMSAHLDAELPDLTARLRGRGNGIDLPAAAPIPSPEALEPWPPGYSMSVLVRATQRQAGVHRIACGLLFSAAGAPVLVGADLSTLAMVLSDDQALIDRYREDCDELGLDEYLMLAGA